MHQLLHNNSRPDNLDEELPHYAKMICGGGGFMRIWIYIYRGIGNI